MHSGTPLDIKKFVALLHTLSAYNSLLIRYEVYSSDPREYLCTQPETILKSMKSLVLMQHHIKRIISKNKIVIANYQSLLLGNYTEIIASQLKFV